MFDDDNNYNYYYHYVTMFFLLVYNQQKKMLLSSFHFHSIFFQFFNLVCVVWVCEINSVCQSLFVPYPLERISKYIRFFYGFHFGLTNHRIELNTYVWIATCRHSKKNLYISLHSHTYTFFQWQYGYHHNEAGGHFEALTSKRLKKFMPK